jgi:hypothetical protein
LISGDVGVDLTHMDFRHCRRRPTIATMAVTVLGPERREPAMRKGTGDDDR